jgi:hypothetical protein
MLSGDLEYLNEPFIKTPERGGRGREDAPNTDKIFRKQTLETLNPRILDPFLPTDWEKNHSFQLVFCNKK